MAQQALFEGLVYDERERPVATAKVGAEAYYVVDDDGFHRHISSAEVDRQVLNVFLEQLHNNREIAVEQALKMLGKDDLFTKAALDASMRNVNANQILAQGIPEEARNMMGMLGFRIIINLHGDVVELKQPYVESDE